MIEKYVLEVDIDYETGEEHCSILKTDGTTNMANWIEIVSAMYTHHSILEPLVDELNKIQNNYNNSEKYAIKLWEENEQLKERITDKNIETEIEIGKYIEKVLKVIDEENMKYWLKEKTSLRKEAKIYNSFRRSLTKIGMELF